MKRLLLMLSITCLTLPAFAQWDLAKNVVEYKLLNGMVWLLVKRQSASIFAGAVEVKVGGVDEKAPYIGLAHMFEHMAFKGTREIGTTDYAKEAPILQRMAATTDPKEIQALQKEARKYQVPNELFTLLTRSGARDVNAYTSKDATQYHSEMPSNQLPLWLHLYAGMVSDPVLREFYAERDVVQEERRMRVENNPHGKAYQTLINAAFTTSPYHYSGIGTSEEIGGLTMTEAMAFHKAYYHPDRMMGALVGDINIPQAKQLIAQTFGKIPAIASQKSVIPQEPKQTAIRRVQVKVDSAPFVLMGYHKPRIGSPEDYIFDVLNYVMCQGASSRLYHELVVEKKVANSIACSAGIPGDRLENLYYIEAFPIAGHSPDELQGLIQDAFNRLAKDGVTDAELEKARNNLAASVLWEMNSDDDLAELLVTYQMLTGDWRYILTHATHIEAVKNADVKRVARELLIPENLTVVSAEK